MGPEAVRAARKETVKVVERSEKKVPVWVGKMETGYIVTSAVADDLERAKSLCMDQVRSQVIESVAQNVQVSSESTLSQETMTEGITDFVDNFSSTFKTQAATVPFLSGISASKAEDSYWEKRVERGTGRVTWLYAVKYPFPRIELKRLVDAFNTRDAEMVARYDRLREMYDGGGIESVEQIDRAVSELTPLIDYFFDDVRKGDARMLQRNYGALYGQVFLSEVSARPGEYVYRLMLGDRPISCSRKPSLRSETLAQLHAEKRGMEWVVTYDYSTADVAEENAIQLAQRIGSSTVRERIVADLSGTVVEVTPQGEAILQAGVRTDSLVGDVAVRMAVRTNRNDLTVKSITLRLPGVAMPVTIDGGGILGGGEVAVTLPGRYERMYGGAAKGAKGGRMGMLRGTIVVADGEGKVHRVAFSAPAVCNW